MIFQYNNKKAKSGTPVCIKEVFAATNLLHAEDDPIDPVKHSLTYYAALQKAGVPVEMHLYAQGGHAFGLRPTKLPIGHWPALVEQWLHTIGMLGSRPGEQSHEN